MINIAELLKDAPKGMKLYSPLFGEVEFMEVGTDKLLRVHDKERNGVRSFDFYGRYFYEAFPDAECLLFPSKDCRTWEEWKLPVEPKFKVGDWIANDYCAGKVTALTDDAYLLDSGQGIPFSCEHNAHLWTIADAKDGDVLVCSDWLFILKQFNVKGNNHKTYCHYDLTLNRFKDDTDSYMVSGSDEFHPANKVQRDLLFAKMREAGYEWDEKKKELRKIKPHYDIANFHAGMPVLVRNGECGKWCYTLYSHYDSEEGYHFTTAGDFLFVQCIPFKDDTKHLLGTTDMCDEQYINW